jgi:hypothetical protein
MRSPGEIRVALESCYLSMEALCADLDWNVRDVVNHVTSMEAVVARLAA